MANWTDQQIHDVWQKARYISGDGPEELRADICGAYMRFGDYGNDTGDYGWEIDHIYPEDTLQRIGVPQNLIDDMENLQPLQASNNASRQNAYPAFHVKVRHGIFKNNDISSNNETVEISPVTQFKLERKYKSWLINAKINSKN